MAAGRHLPMYIVIAMVFATWFGAETVLGISATFLEEGLRGLLSDPFGASLCLILFGLFFARHALPHEPADHRRLLPPALRPHGRGHRSASRSSLSYLGWVSAQITALGLVFNILSEGVDLHSARHADRRRDRAASTRCTAACGRWRSPTFFQMTVIVIGLFYIAWLVADMAGGVGAVVGHAEAAGKFNFWPELSLRRP